MDTRIHDEFCRRGQTPVMTPAEAREILGEEAKGMSDEYLEQLIDDFDVMARFALQESMREASRDRKIARQYEAKQDILIENETQ